VSLFPIANTTKGLVMGPFVLTDTGITVRGKVSSNDYFELGDFVQKTFDAGGWWMADWLKLGEDHPEWAELIDAKIGADEISENTKRDYLHLAHKFPAPARIKGVTISHYQAVQGLEPSDRQKLLERVKDENLTRQDTRREARVLKRRTVSSGQAELAGKFRVIYADPPWNYSDQGVVGDSGTAYGKTGAHYDSMTTEQLCKMPIEAHTTKNAVLFLWVTSPMLNICWPVIEAWGFTYKTSIVWDKVLHNFGHYVSVRHELLLICTRGSCTPDRPTPMPDSVQTFRRGDVHSQKPEEFRQLIQQLYDGPYLELFARMRTPGWSAWGNQVGTL
jgi:N6-adenosine-specific RNA methylase IME4